eukprot:CAMPEP_0115841042 /NCGR_PEP_ID=MMETSP0287-20121206/7085_1 /TAXON_ID=412157 /ORGANISM="Chrysochromulina rotalis, Strain UIO044" /LENGTH=295 /DNA_ID=CAMNT_0003294677 /DNA_START=63 /DNA_END=950 /DNA_ORIENTATION=-
MVCCPITTDTGSVRLVERCGQFNHITSPGLSFLVCCIDSASEPLSMRLQQLPVSCETKTADNVFTTIKVSIQFQITKDDQSMYNAYYRLSNPKAQIESYVYDVVRASVPKIELDNLFLEKEEISKQISANLKENFGSFGYEILATPITEIEPAPEVKHAMNQINKAKRIREAAKDEGEAIKIRAIKDAEAAASAIEIQAAADAEAMYLSGKGIARQRQAIMSGLRESVNAFGQEVEGIDAKQVLDLMIVTQYFDMMSSVGNASKSNALFLNHSPAQLADLTSSVNRGFLASTMQR